MKQSTDAVEIDSLDVAGLGLVTRGLEVAHPLFGPGRVVALFKLPPGGPIAHSIGVEFPGHGYKALAPAFAKLTRR
jgi:hypothetical protein